VVRRARLWWLLSWTTALCAVMPGMAQPAGPVLRVAGDRLLVDGVPRFLVFFSYFDGVRRPEAALHADLDYLSQKGIDGIRVLPNWKAALLNTDGGVRQDALRKLTALVAAAGARGMLVDVTFTRETSCPPGTSPSDQHCAFSVAEYTEGIRVVADALKPYENVLFDIQNEFTIHFSREELASTPHPVAAIRRTIKTADPRRIVTASSAGGEPPAAFANTSRALELDVVAYHDGRDSDRDTPVPNWATRTTDVVAALRGSAKAPSEQRPIYLQEPTRFLLPGEGRRDTDNRAESYGMALALAKRAGAAAWTFHTPASFALDSTAWLHAGEGRQGLLQDSERAVLDSLNAQAASVEWGGLSTPPR
jgi:Cellulase (glycosyl hydrolase family 5)